MNKQLIRVFLLLLCCIMVVGCFASCNNEGGNDPVGGTQGSGENNDPNNPGDGEEDPSDSLTNDEVTADLPDVYYGDKSTDTKREFAMYLRNNDYYIRDQWLPELMGNESAVDKAVYERNAAVEERFGVVITMQRSSNSNLDTDLLNTIVGSNSCDYDVIANHGRGMFTYATSLALMDWNDLKWVDLTKPYWNQGMIKDFTVNDTLFCLSGDISYQSLGATLSMVFNKGTFDSLGLEYPYEDVLAGNWTFAKFSELISQANGDVDGVDGLTPEGGDIMGYMTCTYRGPLTVLYSGGGSIVTQTEDGTGLQLTLYTSRNVDLYEDYFELCDQENCKIYTSYTVQGLHETFANGDVLFMDTRLYDISELINAGMTDYGVLPWPKYDDLVPGTTYYAWCDAVGNTFGIPECHDDDPDSDRAEFISVILEALAEEGYHEVTEVFYEDVLRSKYAQDPDAYEVMDLIKAGRRYDIASYMTSSLSSVGNCGVDLISYADHNFTNWWNGKKSQAETQIMQVNAIFQYITAEQ